MSDSLPVPSLLRRALAVGVGLFATWQLLYLPAANLIDFVPRRPHGPELEPINDGYQAKGAFTTVEPLQRVAEFAGDTLDFWSEFTGQEQGWSLFAPGPPPYSVFPTVEFRFADGTSDTALSLFEPTDKKHPPLRAPIVDNRLFNVEAQLTYPVWYAPPRDVAEHPEFFRDLPDSVRVWRGPIRAYLAWRLKQYRVVNPDRGITIEVILKHRFIQTPKPGESPEWTQPPQERPFAKWRLADDSFEAFDAVNNRFVPVEAKP